MKTRSFQKQTVGALSSTELDAVTGGQDPRGAVVDALNKRFDPGGAPMSETTRWGAIKNGVQAITGKFAVFSGNDVIQRSFTADFDVSSQAVSNLRTKQLSAE
jgi:hypothetical protein